MKTCQKIFSVIIIIIISFSISFAGPVHIVKKGGKIHANGSIRYHFIFFQTYEDGSLKYLICKGRGNNLCDMNNALIAVNNVIITIPEVEKMIQNGLDGGVTYGSGTIKGVSILWKKAKLLKGKYLEYIVDIGKNVKQPVTIIIE